MRKIDKFIFLDGERNIIKTEYDKFSFNEIPKFWIVGFRIKQVLSKKFIFGVDNERH